MEREKAAFESQEAVENDWMFERSLIAEEEDEIFTRRTLHQARALRISVEFEKEDWETTSTSSRRVLSDRGTARYREKIREELRWKQDRRAHFVSMMTSAITPIVGIVGAITGLVAVLMKAHGG